MSTRAKRALTNGLLLVLSLVLLTASACRLLIGIG